jgi:hypothetical protein
MSQAPVATPPARSIIPMGAAVKPADAFRLQRRRIASSGRCSGGIIQTMDCRCGCGQPVGRRRSFVNKTHQLRWMAAGGASELNALQPLEAKERGGSISGKKAAASGRLDEMRPKAVEAVREITERWRRRH